MSIKSKTSLPFNVKTNSAVTGGYADQLHSEFYQETEITNNHEDDVIHDENGNLVATLQSPFTERWVGGRSYRHVSLNTGSDTSESRPEGWHVDLQPQEIRIYSNAYRNSPPAYWTREERTKRPINIKNIGNQGLYIGNYNRNYDFLQTSARRITNNLIVDGYVAGGVLTTQYVTGANEYTLPQLDSVTGSKSIFVERFNAPGSKEESSRGALDREGEEMSPNIPLPFRNHYVRRDFYNQLSQSTPQFGGTIHQVNRNRLVRGGKEYFDNGFVTHAIPRTDIQYSWITASSNTTAAQLGGYQSFRRSDSTEFVYNKSEAYTDIDFISGSLVLNDSQEYFVDNSHLRSLVKDKKSVNLDTNTFSIDNPGISASFSEITNMGHSHTTWTSLRVGDSILSRQMRKNNILSILNSAKQIETEAGPVIPKRGDSSTNYTDPVVTFKYKPLRHVVSLGAEDATENTLVHDYANQMSSFANKDLLIKLNKEDQTPQFYDLLREQIRVPEESSLFYKSHSYNEIVWPKEENTGLDETRKRKAYYLDQAGFTRDGYDIQLGTQRAFWRDNQTDRKRSNLSDGGYYSSFNFLSTQETGSDFNYTFNHESVRSIVTGSFIYEEDNDSNKGAFNSISILEKANSEKQVYSYSGSKNTDTKHSSYTRECYNEYYTNKRAFSYNISGEFNSLFIDFYEKIRLVDYSPSSLSLYGGESSLKQGSLYRNSGYSYMSYNPVSSENADNYYTFIIKNDDSEYNINPKLKYVSFVGGVETNTSNVFQNLKNYNSSFVFPFGYDYEGGRSISVVKRKAGRTYTEVGNRIYLRKIGSQPLYNSTGSIIQEVPLTEIKYINKNDLTTGSLTAGNSYSGSIYSDVSYLNTPWVSTVVSGTDLYIGYAGSYTGVSGSAGISSADQNPHIVKYDTVANEFQQLTDGITLSSGPWSGYVVYGGAPLAGFGVQSYATEPRIFKMLLSGSDLYFIGNFSSTTGSLAYEYPNGYGVGHDFAKYDTSSRQYSTITGTLDGDPYAYAYDRNVTETNGVGGMYLDMDITGSDIYIGGVFEYSPAGYSPFLTRYDTIGEQWHSCSNDLIAPIKQIEKYGDYFLLLHSAEYNIYSDGMVEGTVSKYNIATDTVEKVYGTNDQQSEYRDRAPNRILVYGDFLYCFGNSTVTKIDLTNDQVYQIDDDMISYNGPFVHWDNYVFFEDYPNKYYSRSALLDLDTDKWIKIDDFDLQQYENDYFSKTFSYDDFSFSTLDNGLQRTTEHDSGKKPFFDSYDDFIETIRGVTKDHSIVPEFNISEHMPFYDSKGYNFRHMNSAYLTLDGVSGSYRSANSEVIGKYKKEFMSGYVDSDILKKKDRIEEDSKDISKIESVNIKLKGIKKLLPYNGFYPQDRITQIGNLYSDYIEKNLDGGTLNVTKETILEESVVFDVPSIEVTSSVNLVNGVQPQITSSATERVYSTDSIRYGQKNYFAYTSARSLHVMSSSNEDLETFSSPIILSSSYVSESPEFVSSSGILYLFNFDTVYKTSNNGSSWTSSSLGVTDTWVWTGDGNLEGRTYRRFVDNGNGGIAGLNDGKIYHDVLTSNMSSSLPLIASTLYRNGETLYIANSSSMAYSTDNGYTWSTPVVSSLSSSYSIELDDASFFHYNNSLYGLFYETSGSTKNVKGYKIQNENDWSSQILTSSVLYDIRDSNINNGLNSTAHMKIAESEYDNSLVYSIAMRFVTQIDNSDYFYADRLLVSSIDVSQQTPVWSTWESNGTLIYSPNYKNKQLNPDRISLANGKLEVLKNNQGENIYLTFFTNNREIEYHVPPSYPYATATKNSLYKIKYSNKTKYQTSRNDARKAITAIEPILGPGILYNTIKSGLAVDWPCLTGSIDTFSPYKDLAIASSYYPKQIEMFTSASNIAGYSYDFYGISEYEDRQDLTAFGSLRSVINYRAPFESIIFPESVFQEKDLTNIELEETYPLGQSLSTDSDIYKVLNGSYIYGGYEPYVSKYEVSDFDNNGPRNFSTSFIYKKQNSSTTSLYSYAVNNFLAESIRFFLKGEQNEGKMVSFVSKEDDQWGVFESGKTYYMDVILEKSKDLVMMEAWHSDKHPTGSNGEKMDGRYFGYPVNKTDKDIWGDEEFTAEEAKLIHNDPAYAPYTPPYYEGKAIARISFTPSDGTKAYTFDEVVAASSVENIFNGVSLGASTGSDAYINAMPVGSSVNLFGSKRGTILDSDGLETQNLNVKQWVISPKMETPVLDFSSSQELVSYQNDYSKTSGFGRGMWSGYGQVPENGKQINLKIDFPFPSADTNTTGSLVEKVFQVRRPSEKVKTIGRMADQKVISEAVVVIPYLERRPNDIPTTTMNKIYGDKFYNFIRISDSVFREAKNQVDNNAVEEETSITKMISSMKKYVIPPNMNFLQYDDIKPFVMYVFEVEHTLDQQDLVDIWQGLMPKISYTAEEIYDRDDNEGITIEHQMGEKEFFHGRDIPEDIKWMVFKIKRKAEADYANVTEDSSDDEKFLKRLTLGRQEGEYSYNWPYDYFSLVELAKVEVDLTYKKKE